MEPFSPRDHDRLIHQLLERIKELNCICAISEVTANPEADIDEILQNCADKIPLGFQAPESMCVCLTVFHKTIRTANFKTCRWKIEADLNVDEKIFGKMEVGYLGVPPNGNLPFLDEEKKLVQVIADRIGMIILNKIVSDSLKASQNRFRNLVDNFLVGIFQVNLSGDFLYP